MSVSWASLRAEAGLGRTERQSVGVCSDQLRETGFSQSSLVRVEGKAGCLPLQTGAFLPPHLFVALGATLGTAAFEGFHLTIVKMGPKQ